MISTALEIRLPKSSKSYTSYIKVIYLLGTETEMAISSKSM